MEHGEQSWANEGGHMSSTAGRVTRVSGAELPYVAILSHHESEATEHAFATMREAEAFIKRNTPVPGRPLSRLYDRAVGEGRPAHRRINPSSSEIDGRQPSSRAAREMSSVWL